MILTNILYKLSYEEEEDEQEEKEEENVCFITRRNLKDSF